MALAGLKTPRFAPALLAYVPSFSVSYANSLRMLEGQDVTLGATSAATAAAAALSNAYAAIKLWMLLAEQCRAPESQQEPAAGDGIQESNAIRRVWNGVWPPFENVILSSLMSTGSVSQSCIINIDPCSYASTVSQLEQLYGDRMLIWSCSFLHRDPSYLWTPPLNIWRY